MRADAPAGIDLSDARVHGSHACAYAGNLVHVLRLVPN
jgi:hypothetical protein